VQLPEKFRCATVERGKLGTITSKHREEDRGHIESIQNDYRGSPDGSILGDRFSVLLPAVSLLDPASATWEIPVRLEECALSHRVACHRQRLSA